MAVTPSISFSSDFKRQYHNRQKLERDEIDNLLKKLSECVKYIAKNDLPFRRIKFKVRAGSEILDILVVYPPRIIVKRLE